MNERLRKTPLESDISQGPSVISVRHTSLDVVRRLFDRESLMVNVYNWTGSLCLYPQYFGLRNRPNKVVDSKEKVEACQDVLFMFPVDLKAAPTESSKVHEKDDSVYDIGDEKADRFFESFREPYGLEKDSIAVGGSCKYNFKKIIQDEFENLQPRLKDTIEVLRHGHPDRFWRILFEQKIDFSVNDTSVTWSDEAGADEGGLYREFLLGSMENFVVSTLFFGKKCQAFFDCVPQDIVDKKYKMLGHITALSILYINRGPECLHQSVTVFSIQMIKISY